MCRLFFQIGENIPIQTYEEYIAACEDYKGSGKSDTHELNELKLFCHKDGFGYAYVKQDHFEVRRFSESIVERNPIDDWLRTQTNVLLAHARRASPSIKVTLQNNHPFYWYNGNEYVFVHNGTIKTQITDFDKQKFFVRGTTDSERYFYTLLTAMRENEWRLTKSIVMSILENWDYTGANFILSSTDKAWVGVFHRKHPLYYTMKLYKNETNIVVSSSFLPSLGEPKEVIPNGSLIEIDINSQQYFYHD